MYHKMLWSLPTSPGHTPLLVVVAGGTGSEQDTPPDLHVLARGRILADVTLASYTLPPPPRPRQSAVCPLHGAYDLATDCSHLVEEWTPTILRSLLGDTVPASRRLLRAPAAHRHHRFLAALQRAALLGDSGHTGPYTTALVGDVTPAQVVAAILADLDADPGSGEGGEQATPPSTPVLSGESLSPTSGAPPGGHAREAHPRPQRVTTLQCRTSSRRGAGHHGAPASLPTGPPGRIATTI